MIDFDNENKVYINSIKIDVAKMLRIVALLFI